MGSLDLFDIEDILEDITVYIKIILIYIIKYHEQQFNIW